MEKKPKNTKPPVKDINTLGADIVSKVTGQYIPLNKSIISRVMSEMGRRGGKAGGPKRAEKLSPERRAEIARDAANKRWNNK